MTAANDRSLIIFDCGNWTFYTTNRIFVGGIILLYDYIKQTKPTSTRYNKNTSWVWTIISLLYYAGLVSHSFSCTCLSISLFPSLSFIMFNVDIIIYCQHIFSSISLSLVKYNSSTLADPYFQPKTTHLHQPSTHSLFPSLSPLSLSHSLSLLSLIHIWRCRRYAVCRSRWSPYH